MTLLDAPQYDSARARRRSRILYVLLAVVVVCGVAAWFLWDWPEEHKVDRFLGAVEARDMARAYGIWNNDSEWQKHPEKYTTYPFSRFQEDWAPMARGNDYGVYTSHKILMAKTVGSGSGRGVVVGVEVNGKKSPILFLRVDHLTKAISFSNVELYTGP